MFCFDYSFPAFLCVRCDHTLSNARTSCSVSQWVSGLFIETPSDFFWNGRSLYHGRLLFFLLSFLFGLFGQCLLFINVTFIMIILSSSGLPAVLLEKLWMTAYWKSIVPSKAFTWLTSVGYRKKVCQRIPNLIVDIVMVHKKLLVTMCHVQERMHVWPPSALDFSGSACSERR